MNNNDRVDELEKEAKYTIIKIEEEIHDQSSFERMKEELEQKFNEFREWLNDNVDQEEIARRFEKLKEDCACVLAQAKVKAKEFNEREDVINGKEKLNEVGDKVMDVVNEAMQNEHVSKTIDTIQHTFTQIKEDERVKTNVIKLKKGTLNLAEKAFNGLKKVLDTDEEKKG